MKVIHFLNELKFSGAEIMYVDAAPIFQQLGCELTVVNTAKRMGEYAPYFEKAGYKVLHLPYPNGVIKRFQYYRKIISYLKKEHIDVVHIHASNLKWGLSYCAWKAGCNSVYTFHNVFKSHWYSFYYQKYLRWSAKHIFGCVFQSISDSVYNNEKNYYNNDTVKIYNWYGINRFSPATEKEKQQIRKEMGIRTDTLVIISVGGCSSVKRHTEIIRALSLIKEKIPNVLYLHLGEGVSLQEEKDLADKIEVSEKIRFCGNQENVRKYLIASDIYVMPSRFEGIPITTIEAMACYIPAVLYDVPGLRDFNKEKECSVLISEDYKLLANSIISLYLDKNKKDLISYNAKKYVDSHFNMNINAKRVFELYQ